MKTGPFGGNNVIIGLVPPVGGSSVIAAGAIGLFWWRISPPNRPVNLYRGRGGDPGLEGGFVELPTHLEA